MNEVLEHCPECLNKHDERIELEPIEWSPFGKVFHCRNCGKEYQYKDLEVKIDTKGA